MKLKKNYLFVMDIRKDERRVRLPTKAFRWILTIRKKRSRPKKMQRRTTFQKTCGRIEKNVDSEYGRCKHLTMKLLIVEPSPLPILTSLRPKYSPQDPVFKYP